MDEFKGKQFEREVILLCVGYYCRFSLSYREIAELMQDRGLTIHHTTIMRWVHQYADSMYRLQKKKARHVSRSWRLDETYIKIKGKWHYLYRAIDKYGETLDFGLSKTRDACSASHFFRTLLSQFETPFYLVTDHTSSLRKAIKLLKLEGRMGRTRHVRSKHRNNIVEQDHRQIKKHLPKSNSFQSMKHTEFTIKGIEVVNAIYKNEKRTQVNQCFTFSVFDQLNQLFSA